jgi:predicted nucleotidyltransferase
MFASRSLSEVLSNKAVVHLREFRRDVERAMPGQVTKIVLFGSRARGDARRGSDYDIAVFVRDLGDRRRVDHALADLAYPHILQGIHIRPVAVPTDYLECHPAYSLAINIKRDGMVVE